MKKLMTLTFLLCFGTNYCFGQTIQEIFKSFPSTYMPEMTNEAKDSLLENGTYIFPKAEDYMETMKADYWTENNYIRLQYFFPDGLSGFFIIELKKFLKNDGTPIVVYSKFGGSPKAFDQHILLTFSYENNSLEPIENLGLPKTIETKEFLKEKILDSLDGKKLKMNTSYSLKTNDSDLLEYNIYPEIAPYYEWVKTEKFSYIWNGERFEPKEN